MLVTHGLADYAVFTGLRIGIDDCVVDHPCRAAARQKHILDACPDLCFAVIGVIAV
jgi:hypothetical protein